MDQKTEITCVGCGKYLGSACGAVRDQPEPILMEIAPLGNVNGEDLYATYCLECGEKHPELKLLLLETQTARTAN